MTQTMERLLTPEQAAERLAMPVLTLQTWRKNGTGPRFYKLGRRIRYRAEDLEQWIEKQATNHGAAA